MKYSFLLFLGVSTSIYGMDDKVAYSADSLQSRMRWAHTEIKPWQLRTIGEWSQKPQWYFYCKQDDLKEEIPTEAISNQVTQCVAILAAIARHDVKMIHDLLQQSPLVCANQNAREQKKSSLHDICARCVLNKSDAATILKGLHDLHGFLDIEIPAQDSLQLNVDIQTQEIQLTQQDLRRNVTEPVVIIAKADKNDLPKLVNK